MKNKKIKELEYRVRELEYQMENQFILNRYQANETHIVEAIRMLFNYLGLEISKHIEYKEIRKIKP